MLYKLTRFFATCIFILHTLIPNAVGAVGGAGIAYSTEKITEFLVSRAIQKIADGAESIFPGSGEQLIYETADIINITLSYTQAGRALAKMRYGKLDSALKGALSTSRWLPQKTMTSWDHLMPTPLHTWTDAFFPQLQPQLALSSGVNLPSSRSLNLSFTPSKPTTFKMDSGLPSRKGKVDGTPISVTPGKDPGSIKILPRTPKTDKVDTAPKPTPQIKKITNDSSKNVVNSVKLKAKLAFKEAGILDQHGKLTPKAIRESKKIPLAEEVKNPRVIKELTKDGSQIEDWGKFRTQQVLFSGKRNPYGETKKNRHDEIIEAYPDPKQYKEIHFYMNKKTGKIDYKTVDYKVKDPVTNMPNYKKATNDSNMVKKLSRSLKREKE